MLRGITSVLFQTQMLPRPAGAMGSPKTDRFHPLAEQKTEWAAHSSSNANQLQHQQFKYDLCPDEDHKLIIKLLCHCWSFLFLLRWLSAPCSTSISSTIQVCTVYAQNVWAEGSPGAVCIIICCFSIFDVNSTHIVTANCMKGARQSALWLSCTVCTYGPECLLNSHCPCKKKFTVKKEKDRKRVTAFFYY